MKKAIFLKSVSTVVGASSGLLASVASASCGAETKYTEGEILIQRTDLYLVGDADNLTGLIKSITFNIVGLKNQSLSDAKMHFQIEKYAVDYLPNELKNALQIKQTYDSKNNIVTVEVQVEDG
jgi:hypothetical protein